MTSKVNERALGASKYLAWILGAIAVTGCASDGSGPTSSTTANGASAVVSTSSNGSSASAAGSTSTTSTSPSSTTSNSSTSGSGRSGGGASLVFSYSNGFANSSSTIQIAGAAQLNGSIIALSSPAFGQHQAGAAWAIAPQNIQSFTTDFTFQLDPTAFGITFCIQNTNSTTNPLRFGDLATADANMLGYGAYDFAGQYPLRNSVAIKFDLTAANGQAYVGATPSSTGLYINGGPYGETGFLPENDLSPSGVNLHSGDIMDAHIVYDGTTLTLTLRDTKTNAQTRMSWPVDIPAITGSDYAWVGITAGTIPAVYQNLLSWSYWQGSNQELAAPTFSIPAGQYSSSQTIAINGPSGATIYYTTNGQAPTTSSTQYTGPITVGSNTVVQAIAVENGFTDSSVGSAYYQIVPNGSPVIDFPSGFSGASNLVTVTGSARLNGSNIQLTDTANIKESGAAWFVTPVNVQSFTTSFMVNLAAPANANGFTFTIQNQNPASTDTGSTVVTGGPTTVGLQATGLGYQGIASSVAVAFNLNDTSGSLTASLTGLYKNGADPTSASHINMSSSGVNLHSGDPLAVTIAYDGATLKMTITDTQTHASFSNSWAIDIPTIVGRDTAYVGFTGATGYFMAQQDISSWTYSN